MNVAQHHPSAGRIVDHLVRSRPSTALMALLVHVDWKLGKYGPEKYILEFKCMHYLSDSDILSHYNY